MEKKVLRGQTLDVKFPNISKEKIEKFVLTLTKQEQDVFYKRFGKDLNEFNHGLNSNENYLMVGIYDKIARYISNEEIFRDYFKKNNIDTTLLKKNLELLTDGAREILISTYGSNLDKFDETKIIDFRKLFLAFKEIDRKSFLFENFEQKFKKTIKYYEDFSVEKVYQAINSLEKDELEKIIMIERDNSKTFSDLNYNVLESISIKLGKVYKHNIYSELGYSKEYINKFIDKLNDSDRIIVQKVISKIDISRNEFKRYRQIIKNLRKMINSDRRKETIYGLCYEYSKDEVDKAIEKLNDYDKEQLKNRYGEDLNNPQKDLNYSREDGDYFVKVLLPKISNMLANKNYVDSKKITVKVKIPMVKKVGNIETKKEQKAVGKSLLELFSDIDPEDLKILVSILPKELRKVLYLKHGKELNECVLFNHDALIKYSKIYDEAIMKLDDASSVYKKGIEQVCRIDKEIFMSNMNKLSQKELKTLKKIHGDNLDKTLPICILNSDETHAYNNSLNKLNTINSLKDQLLERYLEFSSEYITNEDIENMINISLNKYENEIDIERYILKQLYEYLKQLIKENVNRVEKSHNK